MAASARSRHLWPVIRFVGLALGFILLGALLIAWLMGTFEPKVSTHARPSLRRPIGATPLATVAVLDLPRIESAVGSIRPVREAQVASNILARVKEVLVHAGQTVTAGQVLVRLDDADLQARLQQAQAGLAAAESERDRVQFQLDRVKKAFDSQAATQFELDQIAKSLDTAQAAVLRASQSVQETRTILDYSVVRSPMNGTIVDKRVNAGDTAAPGQILLTLYDPTQMQMVASVREMLSRRLAVGQQVNVHIESLDKLCAGTVSEIVPESQAQSRSFLVKVTGPCQPGIYAGMFGRMLIPLDSQRILVIPASAILRIGQLDMVDVAVDGHLQRRSVQLGRRVNDGKLVQVLAGLAEGEQVALAPAENSAHD